jgi:ribosome biogenesis GTPase / thiamine phosphate phosphatase
LEKGIVIKSTGSWYIVRLPSGEILECRIKGKFRLDGMQLTNPVAVGDEVELSREDPGQGVIKKIEKRRNYVARQSPRQRHQVHLLATNIDQAILITTMVDPMLKPGFIDRFLMMTAPYDIPTTIVFNKSDLYDEDTMAYFEELKNVYTKIGYTVLLVSAKDMTGIDSFIEVLKDKISLIGGQSGVGKSSLVNAMEPNLDLREGDISDYSGKGQHTTTFAEMHPLSFGGNIIDTPGIKMLSFNNLEPKQIGHNFKEFFELLPKCKYANCSHINEPNCAVKQAIADGEVSELRYHNYLQILEEVEDQNYWERHKDI